MNRLFPSSFPLAALLLAAGTLLSGCESDFEPPAALTLQTKSAVEVLPADARFVGMMDFQALGRNAALSPFADAFSRLNGEAAARLQAFLDATGFDPRQDLREVYVAMTGTAPDEHPSLAVYADFDRARLQAYVEQHLAGDFDGAAYKGATIYRHRDAEAPLAFALATDNMLVAAADPAGVEAMLDRLAGHGRALKDDAETMRLIALASGGGSAWFVARDVGRTLPHPEAGGETPHDLHQIGDAVQDVAVSIDVQRDGAEGTVFMKAKAGVSASDVADLTKGVVAAMKAAPDLDADRLRLLDDVRVRSQGDEVRVHFFVDNAVLSSAR